jgi:hypothetical protein
MFGKKNYENDKGYIDKKIKYESDVKIYVM